MITYLKNTDFATTVVAFDDVNLTCVDIFKDESAEMKIYDELPELEDAVNYYLLRGYKVISRNVFLKYATKFTEKYNQIIKEL